MQRICVLNMKGGVGKTTTAVHLAAGFARLGRHVLLIDADGQGNVSHALGVRPGPTIRDLMLGDCAPEQAIISGVRQNLDVLPSTTAAFSLDRQLAGETQRETILARRLRNLSGYDVVVLDTAPSMSLLTFNSLLFASEVVIPIAMDPMAIIGARQTLNGVAEVQQLWPERELEVRAILPTFVNPATLATRAALAALDADEAFRERLFKPGIRQCIDLTYAAAKRQTIWEHAPRSRAADDFSALIDLLKLQPVLDQPEKVTA